MLAAPTARHDAGAETAVVVLAIEEVSP